MSGNNLSNVPAFRDRAFFDPDRTAADPVLFEHRHRNKHVIPSIGIKHSFG